MANEKDVSVPADKGEKAADVAAKPAGNVANKADVADDKASKAQADQVKSDQKVLKSLDKEVEGKTEYEKQEAFGRAFEEKEGEDSFRRAARLDRYNEMASSEGDPTRDPVAKQKAMDANTVLPGAAEDAQKIKDVGAKKLDVDTKTRSLDGDVKQGNVVPGSGT